MALRDSLEFVGNARNLRGRWRPAGNRPGQADTVAFVFQGGGSLTAPQVGMLRALCETGLTPDLVLGSSAGAINAVAFATDPGPAGLDRLEAVWTSLRRRHVAPLSAPTLLAAVAGRGDGLVPNSGLRGLLASAAIARTLEGTSIPVHVVATDLASGAAVVFSDGETTEALLASCAFPGLYPPVRVGGRLLVDGGVSADVPVLQAEPYATSPSRCRAGRCRWPTMRWARFSAQLPAVTWLPPAGRCAFSRRPAAGPPARLTSATPRV